MMPMAMDAQHQPPYRHRTVGDIVSGADGVPLSVAHVFDHNKKIIVAIQCRHWDVLYFISSHVTHRVILLLTLLVAVISTLVLC